MWKPRGTTTAPRYQSVARPSVAVSPSPLEVEVRALPEDHRNRQMSSSTSELHRCHPRHVRHALQLPVVLAVVLVQLLLIDQAQRFHERLVIAPCEVPSVVFGGGIEQADIFGLVDLAVLENLAILLSHGRNPFLCVTSGARNHPPPASFCGTRPAPRQAGGSSPPATILWHAARPASARHGPGWVLDRGHEGFGVFHQRESDQSAGHPFGDVLLTLHSFDEIGDDSCEIFLVDGRSPCSLDFCWRLGEPFALPPSFCGTQRVLRQAGVGVGLFDPLLPPPSFCGSVKSSGQS